MFNQAALAFRKVLRRFGYDVRRYPVQFSTAWQLMHLFQQREVDCVIDVGAHHGEFGRLLRDEVGYRGTIVSFEPVSESFAELERASARDAGWHVHQHAVGERDRVMPMIVTKRTVLASLLEEHSHNRDLFDSDMDIVRAVDVPVRRLESIWGECIDARHKHIFLKSDTQGYDFNVIEGLADHVNELEGLQIELPLVQLYSGMTSFADGLERLDALGFEVFGFGTASWDRSYRLLEVDCVMRKRSARLEPSGKVDGQ